MGPRHSWAKAVSYVLAFALMTLALVYLFFGQTAVAQSIRLSRIRRHQTALTPKLAADPRFKSIKIAAVTSSGGGALYVQGTLPAEADLEALKALITSTQPPGPVDYRVNIAPK